MSSWFQFEHPSFIRNPSSFDNARGFSLGGTSNDIDYERKGAPETAVTYLSILGEGLMEVSGVVGLMIRRIKGQRMIIPKWICFKPRCFRRYLDRYQFKVVISICLWRPVWQVLFSCGSCRPWLCLGQKVSRHVFCTSTQRKLLSSPNFLWNINIIIDFNFRIVVKKKEHSQCLFLGISHFKTISHLKHSSGDSKTVGQNNKKP